MSKQRFADCLMLDRIVNDTRAARNYPRLTGKTVNTLSEWIVDAGEDGGPFSTPSDVDVANHERLRDTAEANSADRMEFRERVIAHVVGDASGFGEGRQLEYAMGAEDVFVPHSR